MNHSCLAFTTPAAAPRWRRWFLFSPAARIVLFAIMMIGFGIGIHEIVVVLGWTAETAGPLAHAVAVLSVQALPAFVGYLTLVKLIERRPVGELSLRDIPTYGAAGLVAGTVLFSLVAGVLWLTGSYHVLGINWQVNWLPGFLVIGIGAGIGE